jgi:hypothetical protein
MDRPMAEVQAGPGALLDCRWQANNTDIVCDTPRIDGSLDLSRDRVSGAVETVEIAAPWPVISGRDLTGKRQTGTPCRASWPTCF